MDLKALAILAILSLWTFSQTKGESIEKVTNSKRITLSGLNSFDVSIGQDVIIRYLSTLTIICEINTESGEGRIRWQFNGVNIQFNDSKAKNFSKIRLKTNEELMIVNITDQQAGEYMCILENANTGEEFDRATTVLEVLSQCPIDCQGKKGEKGFIGKRGWPGPDGEEGARGYCRPVMCEDNRVRDKGEPGTQGEMGIKGDMGEKGRKGEIGDNGIRGSKGSNGEMGEKGIMGVKGESGDLGATGENGIQGTDGDEGTQGGQGNKGMIGEKGKQGNTTRGQSGDLGKKGDTGEKGKNGTKGLDGEGGETGDQGEIGRKGQRGSKGVSGSVGNKGTVGKNLIILSINSTYNKNCSEYEKGQIIYDTTIGKFVFCNGNEFQCIPDKPCRGEECQEGDPPITTINPNIPASCVNLIYVIDESASMRPEQQWLRDVANAIPGELERINYDPGVCINNFGILGFGTGEEASRAEQIGRPIDLGGISLPQDGGVIPLWGSTLEVIRVINEDTFAGEGRKEDGFAAIYRALQKYTFVGKGCRKMLLITDEDRDNETPSPDPPYDRVPTLFNLNMQQILTQFSITLSAVISIQFQAQNNQPDINHDTILGLLPNNSVIYYDSSAQGNYSVASDGYVRRDSAAGNTEQTYFQQVRASGGIAWSLPASRTYRKAFTNAFLQFEILPHVPQADSTQPTGGCMLDGCNECTCLDGEYYCQPINNLDYNTTIQCRPTECNQTQVISGFRQPACIDMVFAFAETQSMAAVHNSIKDVAGNLATNLAQINFGQENSVCQNNYCLVGFGSQNDRNSDRCYTQSFPIPPNNQLCARSKIAAALLQEITLNATGEVADGYTTIYTILRKYRTNFQSQSCRHITLVTDTKRFNCGSYTDGNITIPQLTQDNILSSLRDTNVVLNMMVNATFQDGTGNEALGIYRETDGSIVAIIPSNTTRFGVATSSGGSVKQAGDQVEEDYIDLALRLGGSAWDIMKMGEQTDIFTKAFVQAVVIKSSESCGQTQACVECKCVGGELQPCENSSLCNFPPKQTIISCTNDTSDNSTTCNTCSFSKDNNMIEFKFFFHSGIVLDPLKWSRKLKSGPDSRELVSSILPVIGANTLSVTTSSMDFCKYSYEVEIPTYATLKFECQCKSCSIVREELACCDEGTFLYSKEKEGVDVMLALDATEDMAAANRFIFETLLPDLETKLLENSVGIKSNSRNQYIITLLGNEGNEGNNELPDFLRRVPITFSIQNKTTLTQIYTEFNESVRSVGGKGAYGAVKLVLGSSTRPTLDRILILNTNKRRDITIYNQADWQIASYFDRFYNGRRIFSNELKHEKIQPILIVNANLTVENSLNCLGVNNLLECFYLTNNNEIDTAHGNITTIIGGDNDLSDIHQDFVIPGLVGGGHVWDINEIIKGTADIRNKISDSIAKSVVPRVKGKCNRCSCFNGVIDCEIFPTSNQDQDKCQCEIIHGADVCGCRDALDDKSCILLPEECNCGGGNCCRSF